MAATLTATPASGSPLWASVTTPLAAPKVSGRVTVRSTVTGTWRALGASVRSTTRPWYSPGDSVAPPRVRVISWWPPTATVPEAGDSSIQARSVNGTIVPWPLSGAQSVGWRKSPTTMATSIVPSSLPSASSGMSNETLCPSMTAGTCATYSKVSMLMM